jgi:hypothetical protein
MKALFLGQNSDPTRVPIQAIVYQPQTLTSEDLMGSIEFDGDIPPIPDVVGKDGYYYYNSVTKSILYDYIDRPLTDTEKISDLQAQNAQMLLALVQGGLI